MGTCQQIDSWLPLLLRKKKRSPFSLSSGLLASVDAAVKAAAFLAAATLCCVFFATMAFICGARQSCRDMAGVFAKEWA